MGRKMGRKMGRFWGRQAGNWLDLVPFAGLSKEKIPTGKPLAEGVVHI